MRLVSVRSSAGSKYELSYVITDGEGHHLATPCTSWGLPTNFGDVGRLLDAGPEMWALALRHQPQPSDLSTRDVPFLPFDDAEFAPPIAAPLASLLVGSNYRSHVTEQGASSVQAATNPAVFAKLPGTFVGHRQTVPYPANTDQLDYEAELVVVIGRAAANVGPEDAAQVVAGYTVMNDMSRRDVQFNGSKDAILFGKNFPGAAPVGPVFVSADEFDLGAAHRIRTWVNGELRQDGSTADMIFGVPELVSWASGLGLHPGDMIATGTPGGVALFSGDGAWYLKRGDEVTVEVEDVCTLTTHIV